MSRGLRFGIEGYLIKHFGPPVKVFIDKYFNLVAIGFAILLIGGFALIKYVI